MDTILPVCTADEFSAKSPLQQILTVTDITRRLILMTGEHYRDPSSTNPSAICSYVDTKHNGPQCLIGHILNAVGFDITSFPNESVQTMIKRMGLPVHWQTVTVMAAMQRVQDAGGTWATAAVAGDGVLSALISTGVVVRGSNV